MVKYLKNLPSTVRIATFKKGLLKKPKATSSASPIKGTHEKNASQAPYFCILVAYF